MSTVCVALTEQVYSGIFTRQNMEGEGFGGTGDTCDLGGWLIGTAIVQLEYAVGTRSRNVKVSCV